MAEHDRGTSRQELTCSSRAGMRRYRGLRLKIRRCTILRGAECPRFAATANSAAILVLDILSIRRQAGICAASHISQRLTALLNQIAGVINGRRWNRVGDAVAGRHMSVAGHFRAWRQRRSAMGRPCDVRDQEGCMSAFLLGIGFRADMGTCARKLVLLKLMDACEDDGTRIFPAIATIARAAQCSCDRCSARCRLSRKSS